MSTPPYVRRTSHGSLRAVSAMMDETLSRAKKIEESLKKQFLDTFNDEEE